MAQKVTQYVGYFCHQELLKIAQSGHTDYPKTATATSSEQKLSKIFIFFAGVVPGK